MLVAVIPYELHTTTLQRFRSFKQKASGEYEYQITLRNTLISCNSVLFHLHIFLVSYFKPKKIFTFSTLVVLSIVNCSQLLLVFFLKKNACKIMTQYYNIQPFWFVPWRAHAECIPGCVGALDRNDFFF